MAKAAKVTVRVTCKGSGTADIADLHPFQGDLKSLSKDAYKKLRGLILTQGFSFPVFAWRGEGKRLFLIDGHQRASTLQAMREEGATVPPIPFAEIKARTYKEAKEKLLAAAAGFGKIEGQGLYEFLHDAEIGFAFLAESIDFQGFDLVSFENGYFGDAASPEFPPESESDQGRLDKKKPVACPACGHEFTT